MSDLDPRGPAEFEPVRIGPRRRRVDPVAFGVVLIVAALAVAVIKPWGGAEPQVAAAPTASPATSGVPAALDRYPRRARPAALGRHPRGRAAPPRLGDPDDRARRNAGSDGAPAAIADPRRRARPRPLRRALVPRGRGRRRGRHGHRRRARRTDHRPGRHLPADRDAAGRADLAATTKAANSSGWTSHPVNDVPGRGAYLYLRRGVAGAAVRAWAPGRYRMDVLVGDGIRRIDVLIRDHDRAPAGPGPVARRSSRALEPFDGARAGRRCRRARSSRPTARSIALDAAGGPALDDVGAWLDIDRVRWMRAARPRSWRGPTSPGRPTWASCCRHTRPSGRPASVALAPFDDPDFQDRQTAIGSLGPGVVRGVRPAATARPGDPACTP